MTDTNEPVVPATSPAAPPPPTGQPVGEQSVPVPPAVPGTPDYGQAPYPSPTAPARSTGKLVAGIILTVIGGLWTLLGLTNVAVAAAAFADNPGYALGRLVGGLLIPVAVLVVGILLLRASKPKV